MAAIRRVPTKRGTAATKRDCERCPWPTTQRFWREQRTCCLDFAPPLCRHSHRLRWPTSSLVAGRRSCNRDWATSWSFLLRVCPIYEYRRICSTRLYNVTHGFYVATATGIRESKRTIAECMCSERVIRGSVHGFFFFCSFASSITDRFALKNR